MTLGRVASMPFPKSAEEWLIRMHAPDCSEAEREAFHDWLRAAPRHRFEYEKCEKVWTLSNSIKNDPVVLAQVLALGPGVHRTSSDSRRDRRSWAAVTAVVLAVAAWVGFDHWRGGNLGTIVTAQGEQLKVTLADGSVVQMNPRTRLAWKGSTEARRVDLQEGEAFFNVTKDPLRPFVVRAGETEVRVVGTQFAVRREADRVEVVVREGQVDVSSLPSANNIERTLVSLVAGKRLRLEEAQGRLEVSSVDADRLTAWRNGSLEFDADTLEYVIAEVNRFSRTNLQLADPSLHGIRISGRFDVGDTEGLIFNLRERFGIRAEASQDRVVLRAPAR